MNTFNKVLSENRLFEILQDRIPKDIITSDLYLSIGEYLDKYVNQSNISTEEVIGAYTSYVSTFNKHCKMFMKTGKYPMHSENTMLVNYSRQDYDLVLLLSVLLTAHRFRIMELLAKFGRNEGKRLFVGAGPGLEVFITEEKNQDNYIYDIALNDSLKQFFPNAQFFTEYFAKQYKDNFESIFLIELLEHLEDPYELLVNSFDALKDGGKVFLTTATDIPQFDHLYNFDDDHTEFENRVREIGYEIEFKEKITHDYLLMQISPSNHFYILKKTAK